MKVQVQCDHPRGQAAATRLKRRARAFLGKLGLGEAELSILLVGDRGMRRLNRSWRGKDVPTDVLSFPAAGSAAPLLGDVVISLDTAARVARVDRRSVEEELDRYLVHGILHLLGFDHERGPVHARRMAAREEEVLGREGMIPSAPPAAAAARSAPEGRAGAAKRAPATAGKPAGAQPRAAAPPTGSRRAPRRSPVRDPGKTR